MLRLILGRAGSGKSRFCLEEISHRLQNDPFPYAPLLYLIPEQASFQAECALAAASPQGGSLRAHVFTFKRLAWRVLQDLGEKQRVYIDDTGKSMLLLKVLEENKPGLKVFRHAGEQPGSIENLLRLYNEMHRYNLKATALDDILRQKGDALPFLLKDKLTDLAVLMKDMDTKMEGRYLDGEGTLGLLLEKIPSSVYLKQAEVWVDGFYHFTRLEEQILKSLIRETRGVTVTFCLDKESLPEEGPVQETPFYSPALACRSLLDIAYETGAETEKIFLPGENPTRFSHNPVLDHLEKNMLSFPAIPYPGDASETDKEPAPFSILSAQNRRTEVEAAARRIIYLAREHNYRWRHMALLTSEPEEYNNLIKTVFMDYEIPFFLDLERPAFYHPLTEFVRSSLEVITRGWRYESLFRCFKTEFLFPFPVDEGAWDEVEQIWRGRVARLENYVLACGIQGNIWLDTASWRYSLRDRLEDDGEGRPEQSPGAEEMLAEINEARFLLVSPLAAFREAFRGAVTVGEKTAALIKFLEGVSAKERLEFWAKNEIISGELEKSREHNQVYNGVINLLEQLAEMMGEMDLPAALFCRLVETGLDNLTLSLLPPSLDQVMVGDIERTRPGETRCVFVLGANDGALPSRLQEDGLLDEEERKTLAGMKFQLAPGVDRKMLDQQLLIYMAFTSPSSLLWVSYPRSDEGGSALLPSLLVTRLKERFPSVAVTEDITEDILANLAHPRQAIPLLAAELGRRREGADIHPLWQEVYNWYLNDESRRDQWLKQLQGVFYRNTEAPLSAEVSRRLYGDHWVTGVSRLERYRACPFAQFLSHGLKLQERRQYRLETPDRGRFFHMVLHNVTLALQKKEMDFASLDEETTLSFVAEEVARLLPKLKSEILLSSNRYVSLGDRLKKTVGEALLRIVEHQRRSSFLPIGTELTFGAGSEIPSWEYTAEDGSCVEMTGRVDRVDLARDEAGRAYLRIIDYKSGAVDLRLDEVFYGLNMQLAAYLDVLLAASPTWLKEQTLPAGMFYFRIHAPFINATGKAETEQLEEEMLKRYRMRGRALADLDVIRLMDSSLQQGYSAILPVWLNKGDTFHKRSALLDTEQFDYLRRHVRLLLQETIEMICRGGVEISPCKTRTQNACTYCPYPAVCQFDPTLKENTYRFLPDLKEEKVFKAGIRD